METMAEHLHRNRVHKILAHSYLFYFILFLVSVCLDLVFRFNIFLSPAVAPLGIVVLFFGTFLIAWSQHTSRNMKIENLSKETFLHGPYCYTRCPTHWGVFFLMLGFGVIANALFVVLFTLISFILTKFIFLNKEEQALAEKYGDHYIEYKKLVRF